jgi:hypothetical protein
MNDETSELRAELARKDEQIRATRAMLRIECAEYDDNDWPDDLHLADVVEKHLARQAHLAVQEAEAHAERLEAENKRLRNGISGLAEITSGEVHKELEALLTDPSSPQSATAD